MSKKRGVRKHKDNSLEKASVQKDRRRKGHPERRPEPILDAHSVQRKVDHLRSALLRCSENCSSNRNPDASMHRAVQLLWDFCGDQRLDEEINPELKKVYASNLKWIFQEVTNLLASRYGSDIFLDAPSDPTAKNFQVKWWNSS